VIFTALCGHGHLDLAAYDRFLRGELVDFDYPADKVKAALDHLPSAG
jgi:tryptophan synthase beta chain